MKKILLGFLLISGCSTIAFADQCYYTDIDGVEYRVSHKYAKYVTNDFQAFPDEPGYKQNDLSDYVSLINLPFKVTRTDAVTLDSLSHETFLSKYRFKDVIVNSKAYYTDAYYNIEVTTSDCKKFYYSPSRKDLKGLQYNFIRKDSKTITSKDYFDFLGESVSKADIKTTSEYDRFEKKTLLKTDYFDQYLIRGMFDQSKKKISSVQIYLDSIVLTKALETEKSWNNIRLAKDTDANSHEVIQISNKADCADKMWGCTLYETIGIEVSEQFLRKHKDGFELKMIGDNTFIKEINGDVVQSFLNETDRLKSSK